MGLKELRADPMPEEALQVYRQDSNNLLTKISEILNAGSRQRWLKPELRPKILGSDDWR